MRTRAPRRPTMNEASASVIIARAVAVIYLAVAAGALIRKNW